MPGNTPNTESAMSVFEIISNVPPFDGRSPLGEFLQKFNLIAEACKWQDDKKILALKLKLGGDASKLINSHKFGNATPSFEDYKKLLEENYGSVISLSASLARLTTSYQLPSETPKQFFSRIEQLSYDSVPSDSPDFESYRQGLLLSAAKQGIDPDLLRGVGASALSSYETFKGAVLLLKETLNHSRPAHDVAAAYPLISTNPFEPSLQIKELEKQIEDLRNRLNKVQAGENKESRDRHPQRRDNQIKCFRCSRYGHFQRDCTAPQCSNCLRFNHTFRECRQRNKQTKN